MRQRNGIKVDRSADLSMPENSELAEHFGTVKKQTTRLLKCACPTCGYTIRVTRRWVVEAGTPICPTDKISMKCK